jgi:hypothetical protein
MCDRGLLEYTLVYPHLTHWYRPARKAAEGKA